MCGGRCADKCKGSGCIQLGCVQIGQKKLQFLLKLCTQTVIIIVFIGKILTPKINSNRQLSIKPHCE